jgi:hypothetical protein
MIVSVAPMDATKVLAQAKILGISAARIGAVGGDNLEVKTGSGTFNWGTAELHDLWWNALARAMR